MARIETGADIIADAMFRAGENKTTSQYLSTAVTYMNRVYQTLATGASEFLPEYVEDWWWMRGEGSLVLEPVFESGTADVTNGSIVITLNMPPVFSLTDRRIRFANEDIVYKIALHSPSSVTAELDIAYLGDTQSGLTFEAMRVDYQLSNAAQALIGPITGYGEVEPIQGTSPEGMDELWPIKRLKPGPPQMFALLNEQKVRFSHGGPKNQATRVDYRYRPVVQELENTSGSIPLVPMQYRHLLSDMILSLLFLDKNDDRANAAASAAKNGLIGMVRENRRRIAKIDREVGHIYPRPTKRHARRLLGFERFL